VYAVEVGDHGVDVDFVQRRHHLRHRAGQDQIVEVIDVNGTQLGHLHDSCTPEEPMLCCPETPG
jgi:hypothetical protein